MLLPEIISKLISMIYALLALLGAYLIIYTAYTWEKKKGSEFLGARAFLSESFLKDNWKLLFIIFFINASMPFADMFMPFLEENISELIKGTAQLVVMVGIVASEYKWFKLMVPDRHNNPFSKQDSHYRKYK
ncbi:Uncharacterised protein [uncultured archaeon]|nr:Uncharacterised protein [uncultured archaeon]